MRRINEARHLHVVLECWEFGVRKEADFVVLWL
jgi:hypothetical protein